MDGPREYYTKWSKSDRERQISYDVTHCRTWFLKNDTNELIYKTETVLQILKTNLWLPKGKFGGKDKSGTWDEHTQTTLYQIDNQQGHAI